MAKTNLPFHPFSVDIPQIILRRGFKSGRVTHTACRAIGHSPAPSDGSWRTKTYRTLSCNRWSGIRPLSGPVKNAAAHDPYEQTNVSVASTNIDEQP